MGSVEVGPLNCSRPPVCPIHGAYVVNNDACRVYSRDEGFDLGSVEVGPLNSPCLSIRPVDLGWINPKVWDVISSFGSEGGGQKSYI